MSVCIGYWYLYRINSAHSAVYEQTRIHREATNGHFHLQKPTLVSRLIPCYWCIFNDAFCDLDYSNSSNQSNIPRWLFYQLKSNMCDWATLRLLHQISVPHELYVYFYICTADSHLFNHSSNIMRDWVFSPEQEDLSILDMYEWVHVYYSCLEQCFSREHIFNRESGCCKYACVRIPRLNYINVPWLMIVFISMYFIIHTQWATESNRWYEYTCCLRVFAEEKI